MPAIFQNKDKLNFISSGTQKPIFPTHENDSKKILNLEEQFDEQEDRSYKIGTCLVVTFITFVAIALMLIFTFVAIQVTNVNLRGQPFDDFDSHREIEIEYTSPADYSYTRDSSEDPVEYAELENSYVNFSEKSFIFV